MYIIRNLLRYIINAEHCISPTRSVVYHQAAGLDKIGSKVFAGGFNCAFRLGGILPNEEMTAKSNTKRNAYRRAIPSGNTYSTSIKDRVLSSNLGLRPTTKRTTHKEWFFLLAGVARFELTNEGVKVPCLTAWRYPFGTWLLYHKSFLLSSSKMRFVRGCKGQGDQARLSITVPSDLTMLSAG